MTIATGETEQIFRNKVAALVDYSPGAIDCGVYQDVWQLRAYRFNAAQGFSEFWVVCLFHCDLWHEHVTGDTQVEAIEAAKHRIDARISEGR